MDPQHYPPLADYGLISDCHSSALVSRWGSIDWCCLPRFDSPSCFGRLLDWERGGYCSLGPADGNPASERRYLGRTMVLESTFRDAGGTVRLLDCMAMRRGGRERPRRQVLRILEGVDGTTECRARVVPRLEYGAVHPWLRDRTGGVFTAQGGHVGLIISGTVPLAVGLDHSLMGHMTLSKGERRHLSLEFAAPETLDSSPGQVAGGAELDGRLQETLEWWKRWSTKIAAETPEPLARSALVLKALCHAPTGAFVAAPTTSLPETVGGGRNWDYRYSWVRDSVFSVEALAELGVQSEADGFRRFIERSAAGSSAEIQLMYGLGGEIRLNEVRLDDLEGYRGSAPVRLGNGAFRQTQLDVYGYLLDLAWAWHRRGHAPNGDYWTFLVDLVNETAVRWEQPDSGIWEVRGTPENFVYSKAMCWAALDRGIRLAEEIQSPAPMEEWRAARGRVRAAIESRGYDPARGVFVRSFDATDLDAALLLLPVFGFVEWDDPRMVRTAEAIYRELGSGPMVRRYLAADGLEGTEGEFVACSFWLAQCFAHQGRLPEARRVFAAAAAAANDLGLFSEEYQASTGELLGNFPQALSHLAHLTAGRALRLAGA